MLKNFIEKFIGQPLDSSLFTPSNNYKNIGVILTKYAESKANLLAKSGKKVPLNNSLISCFDQMTVPIARISNQSIKLRLTYDLIKIITTFDIEILKEVFLSNFATELGETEFKKRLLISLDKEEIEKLVVLFINELDKVNNNSNIPLQYRKRVITKVSYFLELFKEIFPQIKDKITPSLNKSLQDLRDRIHILKYMSNYNIELEHENPTIEKKSLSIPQMNSNNLNMQLHDNDATIARDSLNITKRYIPTKESRILITSLYSLDRLSLIKPDFIKILKEISLELKNSNKPELIKRFLVMMEENLNDTDPIIKVSTIESIKNMSEVFISIAYWDLLQDIINLTCNKLKTEANLNIFSLSVEVLTNISLSLTTTPNYQGIHTIILTFYRILQDIAIYPQEFCNTIKESIKKFASNKEALNSLVKTYNYQDNNGRHIITEIFAGLDKYGTHSLIQLLAESEDIRIRTSIIRILSKMGKRIQKQIADELQTEKTWFFTRNLLYVLGKIGDETNIELIAKYIRHQDIRVQQEAYKALIRLGSPKGDQYISQAFLDPRSEICHYVVKEIGKYNYKRMVPYLITTLDEIGKQKGNYSQIEEEIIKDIAITLGTLQDRRATTSLINLLYKPLFSFKKGLNDTVRAYIAWALGKIGDSKAEHILKKVAGSNNITLKNEAIKALDRIKSKKSQENECNEKDLDELKDMTVHECLPLEHERGSESETGLNQEENFIVSGELDIGSYLGHYKVLEKIGEGGMGKIYKGYDEKLDRFVALKVISEKVGRDKSALQRFIKEARALAKLNCPQITQIYYINDKDPFPFFAMEFVDGKTLREIIRIERRIPIPKAIEIVIEICKGLKIAYENGIIHRDVNPKNLMVNKKGETKIMDFGLVLLTKDNEIDSTANGDIVGTPLYMSPEQSKTGEVDHRSDIYSLGITLYHMIVGLPPFIARNIKELIKMHVESPLPIEDKCDRLIPKSLCEVFKKMTAKNPDERYQNYDDLVHDLEKVKEELIH